MKKISLLILIFLFIHGCSTEPEQEPLTYEIIESEDNFGYWMFIPASRFTWSSDNLENNINYDYWIAKYKVTNLQFIDFLNAQPDASLQLTAEGIVGHYSPDTTDTIFDDGDYLFYQFIDSTSHYNYGLITWDGDKYVVDEVYNNHPVVNVTWFGANVFANYYDYKLPNEFEWEKASRGDTGCDYPWGGFYGDDISLYSNYYDSGDSFDNGTTPIDYFINDSTSNQSPYGVIDMVGNTYEWTNSWFDVNPPFKNGNAVIGKTVRTQRGGSWKSPTYSLRSWKRYYSEPYTGSPRFGFRLLKESN